MSKPKLIIYNQKSPGCSCFENIFNSEFMTELVGTPEQLLSKMKTYNPDAVVKCYCRAREKDVPELLRLDALTNLTPLIACFQTGSSEFVCTAAHSGAEYFLSCSWDRIKIVKVILEAIQYGGIKKFFKICYPDSFAFSSHPHIRKIINIIADTFPRKLNENEFAEQLGISTRWLRTLCKQAFKIKFNKLMRRIWIYQALRIMQLTNFDNTEIALLLNYSEEGSMARDFNKELGYSPTEARKLLANHIPEEMLK